MNLQRLQQWGSTRNVPARLASLRWLRWAAIPLTFWLVVGLFYIGQRREWLGVAPLEGVVFSAPPRMNATILPPLSIPSACKGARGKLLDDSPDDELRYEVVYGGKLQFTWYSICQLTISQTTPCLFSVRIAN